MWLTYLPITATWWNQMENIPGTWIHQNCTCHCLQKSSCVTNVCLHPKVCNILWALWGPLNNTKYEDQEGERGNIWELIEIIVCNYFSMATSNQNMFGVKILHQRNISTNVLMFYCKCNRYCKTATSEASDSCVHKEMALSGFRGQGAPYTFVSNNV